MTLPSFLQLAAPSIYSWSRINHEDETSQRFMPYAPNSSFTLKSSDISKIQRKPRAPESTRQNIIPVPYSYHSREGTAYVTMVRVLILHTLTNFYISFYWVQFKQINAL